MARRAAPGQGTFHQVKTGYQYRLMQGFKPDGSRLRLAVYGRTKAECHLKMEEKLAALNAVVQVEGYSSSEKLGAYLARWLEEVVANTQSAGTYDVDEHYIKNYVLVDEIAKLPLSALTPSHFQGFYNRTLERRKIKPITVNRCRQMLSAALNYAVDLGLLTVNPVARSKKLKEEKFVAEPWTLEEAARFFDVAGVHDFGPIILLMASTGLRRGEALGLRIQDVDLENGVFSVRGALKCSRKMGGVHWGSTKNTMSRRTLPIPRVLQPVLEAYDQRRRRWEDIFGEDWVPSGMFFTLQHGNWVDPNNFDHAFHRLVEKSGVRPARAHDLRHFFATQQLLSGENPKVVQQQLGHSGIRVTMDTYSHLLQVPDEAANRVADQLMMGRVVPRRNL